MDILKTVVQVIIALGILNVSIVRYGKPTDYRGGTAKNMREEFAAYGLPFWFMLVIGAFKLLLAVLLITGIWFPVMTQPAAMAMVTLMIGAVAMHLKAKAEGFFHELG